MAKGDSGKKKDSGKKDSGKKTDPKRRGVKSQDTMANITNAAADKEEKKTAKKPVSTAEQAARIKEALAKKDTPKEDKPKGSSVPKRRAKGPLPANATKTPPERGTATSRSTSQRTSRRAEYNFAIDNIMQDYRLDDTTEGRQAAEEIYKQQRGLDTGDVERGRTSGAPDENAIEVPAGLMGPGQSSVDVDYDDLESGDVRTSIVDEALRGSGTRLDQSQSPELVQSVDRQPGVKVSRQAELVLGIGKPRQPDEPDPSDYWSMNEKPTSVDEANQQLEAAKVRQKALLEEGQEPRSGYGARNERAVTTAQGVESLAKANKSTDEENKLRLKIAALEHGIKNNLFGEGGTVEIEGKRVPIQQVRTGRQNFALSGTTEGETAGLSGEAAKLLTDLGAGAIMRKGQSPTGIPNAVSGLITMPSDDVLKKRGDILDVKTNEDTGDLELANPLQRRMPVITDPATGETRDNPNYPIRSEGGVPIVAGQDGETEETLRGYREVLAGQMTGSKGGKTPESLVRIKGEGRRRGVRKRRVRGDYQGPVVTEERFGLGPEYERIQEGLLADQFSTKDASDIVENMIKTEGTENITYDLLGDLSQTSDTRPETAAGDIDRAKRGGISSIPVRKNVPVLITRDLEGNPLAKPREETQVGTRSDVNTVKGSDIKQLVSLEDVMNIVGGPAITREEPVMTGEKDPNTGLPLQAEDKDYPRDSSRRFRVRRKTYQPADIMETTIDPTTKIKRVVRGINVNAANTGKDLMGRAIRVQRRMNVAGSNKPDAPEGTPLTLGQQFVKEHGLQGVEYDPAVEAEFGTPEDVKAKIATEDASAAATSAAQREAQESVRLDTAYENAARRRGAGWTAEVASRETAATALDKQNKEAAYQADMAGEARAQVEGNDRYQEAIDRAGALARAGASPFDLAVPGSRGAKDVMPARTWAGSDQFLDAPTKAGTVNRLGYIQGINKPTTDEFSGTLSSLRNRAKVLSPGYETPKAGSATLVEYTPALMETPNQTIARERAEGVDTDSLDLQEAYGMGGAYGQAIAQTQDTLNRAKRGEWATATMRNNRLNRSRKTEQPTPTLETGPQIPLNNPNMGPQFQ